MKTRRSLLPKTAVVLASAFLAQVQATENGATNWPLGVNTVIPAILPPPEATEFYSYTVKYSADRFNGKDGKSAIPGFDLDNYAQAFRVVHTWGYPTDSGVRLSSGVIPSGGHLKVKLLGMEDDATGFNQVYLTPLYVTYSPVPELNLLAGFSAFLPLGNYDRHDLANTTSNYSSYVQELGMTWFPTPSWEVSLSPTIAVNARNKATDYRSGDVLNVDFNLGYRPQQAPQWQFGLAGYYTKQFTDDKVDGETVPGGNRLRKLAVGPQLFYAFDQASGVVFKALKETSVENGPKGYSVWFQFALPLSF